MAINIPKWVKWCGGIVAGCLLLLCIAITLLVYILSPSKLTPLVSKYSPDFIDGQVNSSKIELHFWKSFPRLSVEMDSVVLLSDFSKKLTSEQLKEIPGFSDTLLTAKTIRAGINLHSLMNNHCEFFDVVIEEPTVNIVILNDTLVNFNIMSSEGESGKGDVQISVDRFRLINSGPLNFNSIPDSIDIQLRIKNVDFNGSHEPLYSMEIESGGNFRLPVLNFLSEKDIYFGVDGKIDLDIKEKELKLNDFDLKINQLSAKINTLIDFNNPYVVKELNVEVADLDFDKVSFLIPEEYRKDFKDLNTDLSLNLNLELNKPYTLDTVQFNMPSLSAQIRIPESRLKWKSKRLEFYKFILDSDVLIDGDDFDKSEIKIKRLFIDGNAIDLDMRGIITDIEKDPRIAGEVKGRVFLDRLPSDVKKMTNGYLQGIIGLNTKFRLLQSQLNANNFHKIYAHGTVSLRDFDIGIGQVKSDGRHDTIRIYTPLTMLHFESDKTVEVNGHKVDSLLSLTMDADSLYFHGEGVEVRSRDLSLALGSKNTFSSSDRSKINPFGGTMDVKRLRIFSYADSTRVSIRDVSISGSLSRYKEMNTVPDLKLNVQARRFSFGEPGMRVAIGNPKLNMLAHLNPPRTRKRERLDSLRMESVRMNQRNRRKENRNISAEDSLTRGFIRLLHRWDASGSFSAHRGRIYTPAFPINNTIENIDLQCTTDSIEVKSLEIKAGSSNFNIKGYVANILKSIARRRHKEELELSFDVTSDTIHVDEISAVLFAGAAATRNLASLRDSVLWDGTVDDTELETTVKTDTTSSGPLLVTPYVDATLQLNARNVVYMGLLLHDFKGELEVWDSAIRLRDLDASSDFGSLSISALYSAPDISSMEFGMGMLVKDFHLKEFLKVTPTIGELLPAIKDFGGVINADVALAVDIDSAMNFIIPSMEGAVKITGDSLVLLDPETFKSLSKWLMFKNKKENMIKHMSVEMLVDSSEIIVFPFIFDIDRYKLGVMGSNDLKMNLNYHVSVLKSPIPFKFGINVTGNPEHLKIRLGGAKVKENAVVERMSIADDTRINLIDQIEGVFRRGASSHNRSHLSLDVDEETRRMNDSVRFKEDPIPVEADSLLNSPQYFVE